MTINEKKNNYLLFGNPVNHSQSPMIHYFFSKNICINFQYGIKKVKNSNFFSSVFDFFKTGGLGANITVPFKKKAYKLCDFLTKRAMIAQSVNTFKKLKCGKILGDNTDGVGFLYDLKRLNAINYGDRILLIGAGGAARGIIPDLLSLNCSIDIINRTLQNAIELSQSFKFLGNIKTVDICSLKKLDYDLVINSTSFGIKKKCDFFINDVIFYPNQTFFYDLYYSNKLTPFLTWCKKNDVVYFSDGIGMLVSQAAYSFYLWNDIFPDINSTINFLNQEKKYCI